MRDNIIGILFAIGLTIGAGLAWAVSRTWTPEHTSVLLGGFIAFAGLVGVATIVAAWSYGTTHGAGVSTVPTPFVIEGQGREALTTREQLDNRLRELRIEAMDAQLHPQPAARLPVVRDWMED